MGQGGRGPCPHLSHTWAFQGALNSKVSCELKETYSINKHHCDLKSDLSTAALPEESEGGQTYRVPNQCIC